MSRSVGLAWSIIVVVALTGLIIGGLVVGGWFRRSERPPRGRLELDGTGHRLVPQVRRADAIESSESALKIIHDGHPTTA